MQLAESSSIPWGYLLVAGAGPLLGNCSLGVLEGMKGATALLFLFPLQLVLQRMSFYTDQRVSERDFKVSARFYPAKDLDLPIVV